MKIKDSALQFYHKHELKFHALFFLFGFILDYFAAEEIDHLLVIVQQGVYLLIIFLIMSFEYLEKANLITIQKWKRIWQYRELVLHFILGTLLNLNSFFFLKSASVFNSMAFVALLLVFLIGNELPQLKKSRVGIRWALSVLCLFCYLTVLFPLILGFVGWFPFLLSGAGTVLCLYLHFRLMMKAQTNIKDLSRTFLVPGVAIVGLFVGLYFLKLIPPVPLAAKNMGVYHNLEKRGGKFILSHQVAWWEVWKNGDQEFHFRPGDPIYFFAQIFSPAKFSDEVTIHWLYKDPKAGWMTSDKVPMQIHGGRHEGFRGYSVKKNYSAGQWRVQLETTDGREIGRVYFDAIPDAGTDERQWLFDEF